MDLALSQQRWTSAIGGPCDAAHGLGGNGVSMVGAACMADGDGSWIGKRVVTRYGTALKIGNKVVDDEGREARLGDVRKESSSFPGLSGRASRGPVVVARGGDQRCQRLGQGERRGSLRSAFGRGYCRDPFQPMLHDLRFPRARLVCRTRLCSGDRGL